MLACKGLVRTETWPAGFHVLSSPDISLSLYADSLDGSEPKRSLSSGRAILWASSSSLHEDVSRVCGSLSLKEVNVGFPAHARNTQSERSEHSQSVVSPSVMKRADPNRHEPRTALIGEWGECVDTPMTSV